MKRELKEYGDPNRSRNIRDTEPFPMKRELKVFFDRSRFFALFRYRTIPYEEGTERSV